MNNLLMVLLFLPVQAGAEQFESRALADDLTPVEIHDGPTGSALQKLALLMLSAEPGAAFNTLRPGLSSLPAAPSSAKMQGATVALKEGQIVSGVVRKVRRTKLELDIGTGNKAVLFNTDFSEKEDFPDLTDKVKVGAKLRARVKLADGAGRRVKLSIRKDPATPLEDLSEGQAFEGMVTKISKKGALVDIGAEVNALLPVEQASNLKEGEIITGYIAKLDPFEDELLVTTQLERFPVSSLDVNQRVEGKVVEVRDSGVIVDIGADVPVLLPIDKIVFDRFAGKEVLMEMYKPGMDVEGRITSIDEETGRVEMTCRVRWNEFEVGEVVDCKVEKVNQFGLWLDIGAEDQALLHISKIGSRFTSPEELEKMYSVGDMIQCRVSGMLEDKQRVDLEEAW
mmetsp:Transcript_29203/g.51066  ORF Transcript_29203/g.51066 Transcript_29203/m.51066 type:complete len:397 (+) Transcript_29203:66-1256(+)